MNPRERAIPETAKCPLMKHRIIGGEPYCEVTHMEYPHLSSDCNNYKACKYYQSERREDE